MEFSQLIQERYSVRRYASQSIDTQKIEKLTEALLLAPSSKASYPNHYFFVKDQSLIKKLSECKPHGAEFLKEAPLVVVMAADPLTSDVWIEDASIAATYLMLEVVNLELGGCWVQVRNRFYNESVSSSEYIKNILNIDDNLEVLALYGVGYPYDVQKGTSNNNYSPISIIG